MANRTAKYQCIDSRAPTELVLRMPFEDNSRLSVLLRMGIKGDIQTPTAIRLNRTIPCILRVDYWDHASCESIEGGKVSLAGLNKTPVNAADFASGWKPYLVDLRDAQASNIKHLKENVRRYTENGYGVVGATVRIDHDWMYNTEATRLELRQGLVAVSGKPNKELTAFLKRFI